MSLFSAEERGFAEAVGRIVGCNPFLPERMEAERDALGPEFDGAETVWSVPADLSRERPNLVKIQERNEALVARLRGRLADGAAASPEESALYEDAALYLLYERFRVHLTDSLLAPAKTLRPRMADYERFARDAEHFLKIPKVRLPHNDEPAHLFAFFHQIRRAFHHSFIHIVGTSMSAARLRAAIWQSVFTHDLRRYRRSLYQRMGDLTTLITGPSGTGKELVARSIGLSRYIPFDAKSQTFVEDVNGSFHALNLSALSPTLIESELFGHRRGAFTGAVADRVGWLQACPALGTVFLDEIGELDPHIQVKLLRVLQTRTFQRLGDTETRKFHGKVIAATNRDLAAEIRAGRFRTDFYYRICSDLIVTPPLADQLRECPDDLHRLLVFIARRVVGEEEAVTLADEVAIWIEKNLGRDYAWPGNFRELEQCLRNVLIRRQYRPPAIGAGSARGELAEAVRAGTLSVDELLRRYCSLVYADSGSYEEASRRLGVDRRTVKSKVDLEWLARM